VNWLATCEWHPQLHIIYIAVRCVFTETPCFGVDMLIPSSGAVTEEVGSRE
jgi:hypothetical protein